MFHKKKKRLTEKLFYMTILRPPVDCIAGAIVDLCLDVQDSLNQSREGYRG
jgi:hypothetical protein